MLIMIMHGRSEGPDVMIKERQANAVGALETSATQRVQRTRGTTLGNLEPQSPPSVCSFDSVRSPPSDTDAPPHEHESPDGLARKQLR